MKALTKKQLLADIGFLADRGTRTGSVTFSAGRDTGMSSNSIVAIAYGRKLLESQQLPSDAADMDSCENMWAKLPEHRKQGDGLLAMEAARNCDYYGKANYLAHLAGIKLPAEF